GGLTVLGTRTALAREDDDGFLVQVAVRRRLRGRNVADELGNDSRADAFVDEDLEVPRPHLGTLRGIDRDDALRLLRVEVVRHLLEPLDLPQRTGKDEHPEGLPG